MSDIVYRTNFDRGSVTDYDIQLHSHGLKPIGLAIIIVGIAVFLIWRRRARHENSD